MIAGFIFLRLRGILGKRTGFDGKTPQQFDKILKEAVAKTAPKNNETFDENAQKELELRYKGKGLRYGDIKQEFFEKIMDYFEPFRKKRQALVDKPSNVIDALKIGSEKATKVAEEVLVNVRIATGISEK